MSNTLSPRLSPKRRVCVEVEGWGGREVTIKVWIYKMNLQMNTCRYKTLNVFFKFLCCRSWAHVSILINCRKASTRRKQARKIVTLKKYHRSQIKSQLHNMSAFHFKMNKFWLVRSLGSKHYIKEMKIASSGLLSLFMTSNDMCTSGHALSTSLIGTLFLND